MCYVVNMLMHSEKSKMPYALRKILRKMLVYVKALKFHDKYAVELF